MNPRASCTEPRPSRRLAAHSRMACIPRFPGLRSEAVTRIRDGIDQVCADGAASRRVRVPLLGRDRGGHAAQRHRASTCPEHSAGRLLGIPLCVARRESSDDLLRIRQLLKNAPELGGFVAVVVGAYELHLAWQGRVLGYVFLLLATARFAPMVQRMSDRAPKPITERIRWYLGLWGTRAVGDRDVRSGLVADESYSVSRGPAPSTGSGLLTLAFGFPLCLRLR